MLSSILFPSERGVPGDFAAVRGHLAVGLQRTTGRPSAGRFDGRLDVHRSEAAGRLEGTTDPGTGRHARDRAFPDLRRLPRIFLLFMLNGCAGQDLLG